MIMSMRCILAAALLLPAAGFAQQIRADYDRGADFTRFKTYKWFPVKSKVSLDQLTEARIQRVVDAELAARGYRRVEENPDLGVAYQAQTSMEQVYSTTDLGWNYAWGRRWRGWYGYGGPATTTTTVENVPVGTLAILIGDVREKKLLWRGSATDTIDRSSSPEKADKKAAKAAEKLFKKYPVKKQKS